MVDKTDGMAWYFGAINARKATRFQLLKARLFGKKTIGTDGANQCIGYWYKGRLYLTDFTVKETTTRKFWEIVNRNSMFLIALIEETQDIDGEIVHARIVWSIEQFWIWHLLFGTWLKDLFKDETKPCTCGGTMTLYVNWVCGVWECDTCGKEETE